ncbi:MAG: aldehyde dehydrogenase family protein [Thermoplasmata archaeon]
MINEVLKLDKLDGFEDIIEFNNGIPYFKILVGGRWVMASSYIDVRSPINNEIIAKVSKMDVQLADESLEKAVNAKKTMKDLPGFSRIDILEKAAAILDERKDAIVSALSLNVGKTRKDAMGEVNSTLDRIKNVRSDARAILGDFVPGEWSKHNDGRIAIVVREPVGVVLAISPFNYPLFISYTKVIPALVAGNSVLLKPPSAVPIAPLLMAKILDDVGLPKGALSTVLAPGIIASYLSTSNNVDMITFTGSTKTGLELTKISGIKKIHLELGGKASAIVLSPIKGIKRAAKEIVEGSLKLSGQRCDAINRVLVQEEVAQKLTSEILDAVKNLKVGNPFEEGVYSGPLIDREAVERVSALVNDAVQKGARICIGGKSDGNYYEPTVLCDVPLNANIMWEETFGPVIPIYSFQTEDEAVEITNRSEYGLDNSIFTDDINAAWRVAKKIESGEVTVNASPSHGIGFFPFGGVKQSGLGREGIGYSVEEFTNSKTIVYNIKE